VTLVFFAGVYLTGYVTGGNGGDGEGEVEEVFLSPYPFLYAPPIRRRLNYFKTAAKETCVTFERVERPKPAGGQQTLK